MSGPDDLEQLRLVDFRCRNFLNGCFEVGWIPKPSSLCMGIARKVSLLPPRPPTLSALPNCTADLLLHLQLPGASLQETPGPWPWAS